MNLSLWQTFKGNFQSLRASPIQKENNIFNMNARNPQQHVRIQVYNLPSQLLKSCLSHFFAAIVAEQNHFHKKALHLYQASFFVILHKPVLFQILSGPPRIKNRQMNTTANKLENNCKGHNNIQGANKQS